MNPNPPAPRRPRTALVVVATVAAVLIVSCGWTTVAALIVGDPSTTKTAATAPPTAPAPGPATGTSGPVLAPSPPAPSGVLTSSTVDPQPSAGVSTTTVTRTEVVPYPTVRVNDPTLAKGHTKVRTAGVNGVRTITEEVTTTNGVETGRRQLSSVVTTKPVTQVIAVGTKAAPPANNCNPNYRPCVPNASDVDCAGGGGNGPVYVTGPVYVIGVDVYDLDRDGDGVGCE